MNRMTSALVATMAVTSIVITINLAVGIAEEVGSPIFGVTIPEGYRKWELISVSRDADHIKGLALNLSYAMCST